jgi:hypothetical protein
MGREGHVTSRRGNVYTWFKWGNVYTWFKWGNVYTWFKWGNVYTWFKWGNVYTWFKWGNLRKRDHLQDPGVDGRIILRWIFMKWDLGMDWIGLDQDRDRWRAFVNAVMNLRVP